MDFFFNPQGIALIGATANKLKGGYAIFKNLITGFKGGIYPVNPRYKEIDGIKCFKSVKDVPDPVDLAIIFVPGGYVPAIIKDCADRGIKGVMIEAGGFAESGDKGRKMQDELKAYAKKTGIRLWGPNCMGLVDAVHKKIFSFVTPVIWDELIPGDVSLIVQSGMLSGAFLIDCMSHKIMGISKVCSIGNKMDVNECEILEYLIHDPDTKAIGLYLESINNGRRFMEICGTSTKPVVVLLGGKSAGGAAAALSHTASMAVNGAVASGAFAQAGVIEAMDFNEMMDICRSLAAYPDLKVSAAGRVAVLTYTGGAGIVSSDFIDKSGIELAKLSLSTKEKIKSVFPDWMPISNPVDLWPAVERNGADLAYGTAVKAVCEDPGVDAIFVHAFTGGFALNLDMEFLSGHAGRAGKPVFCWVIGTDDAVKKLKTEAIECSVPVFSEISRAVECMDKVFTRKKVLDYRSHDNSNEKQTAKENKNRHDAECLMAVENTGLSKESIDILKSNSGVLDENLSKKILLEYNIKTVNEYFAESPEDAEKIALNLGSKVVMKGIVQGKIHKTEAGLVRIGVNSKNEAIQVFNELKTAMDQKGKILIQEQIKGDMELIAGLMRDPQFGPCVMAGFGGIMAEVLNDSVFGVAPITHFQAIELIKRLKNQELMDGFRGTDPLDRKAFAEILVKLGRLGCDFPQIKEIDINPLIIYKGQPVAVDASVVLF